MIREEAHFINVQNIYLQNHLFEERIRELEADVREKFTSISTFVNELQNMVNQIINELPSAETSGRLALLEKKKRIEEYKQRLKLINKKITATEEASIWLDRNRIQLISYAAKNIFTNEYGLKKFNGVQVSKENVQRFCQDLNSYFLWLGHYLQMGANPKELPNGVIFLALPTEIYIEAFKIILNDKVYTMDDLSEEAVTMLTSYINKFLVKRNLDLDRPQQ